MPAPPSSGWTGSHLEQSARSTTRGSSLGINARPVNTQNVVWDVVASISTNSNKLVSFGRDANGNPILDEIAFGDFLSVQRHREGYPLGGYWAIDVKRDENGRPILGPDGVALLEECPGWAPEVRDQCKEEFVGSPFPTRMVGLTNTVRLFGNLQLYAFLDYQGGHYQWCAICSVRTRTDLNSKEINDPRLYPGHPDYETWGKYEYALLRSAQTKRYIMPADFIKLREISATYTIPNRLPRGCGSIEPRSRCPGVICGTGRSTRGNADPEVNFTSNASYTTSDYGSIPMQRWWTVGFTVQF